MKTRVITEENVRKRLLRRGYHLVTLKGYLGGYMVADNGRFAVYGSDICPASLEDVSAWIDENKEGVA